MYVEPVTVTLRVDGVSREPKTKDGRYLHLGMTTDGRLYGFFAPRLDKNSFVDACGAHGTLKKTKDGDDIVYLKATSVTPRRDVINDDISELPPLGTKLFGDLPAFHPWHPEEPDYSVKVLARAGKVVNPYALSDEQTAFLRAQFGGQDPTPFGAVAA